MSDDKKSSTPWLELLKYPITTKAPGINRARFQREVCQG